MDEIDIYLKEDLGEEGDITSNALFHNETAKARIVSNEDCVVAGLEEVKKVFEKTGAKTKLLVKNGEYIKKGTSVAEIIGSARSILTGERLSLNIMGRMSAIATETKKLVEKCSTINPKIKIAATRKTTPGFRKFEKKAVIIGGGDPHRFGLFDEIMIKDNHIKIIGSIEKAVKKIKEKISGKTIEVEVGNESDALIVMRLGVDVIMLDNFKPDIAKNLTMQIKKINPEIVVEISGGVTPENIFDYASFADRISLGYLTHSIKNIDFSLEIN